MMLVIIACIQPLFFTPGLGVQIGWVISKSFADVQNSNVHLISFKETIYSNLSKSSNWHLVQKKHGQNIVQSLILFTSTYQDIVHCVHPECVERR